MKTLFNLLKLFPAFQKLLNEFFEGERAKLKKQIDDYRVSEQSQLRQARQFEIAALQAQERIEELRTHISTLENAIRIKNTEIEELRNATTKKLQAVDSLPADDVWTGVLRPKPRP